MLKFDLCVLHRIMAFPFDLLDLLLPDIASWMAGRSSTYKKRMARAGTGLLLMGMALALCCLIFETAMAWAGIGLVHHRPVFWLWPVLAGLPVGRFASPTTDHLW